MAIHQEIELKWELDEPGHSTLRSRLPSVHGQPRLLDQTNRFFDTQDRALRRSGQNLRLRSEGSRVLVTCKRRVSADNGLHHHEEWEQWLEDGLDDPVALLNTLELPPGILRALDGRIPEEVGRFTNQRLEFQADGELICLDRTTFRTRIDYELEVETSDPLASRTRWDQNLGSWGIKAIPQTMTKFARMLALGD